MIRPGGADTITEAAYRFGREVSDGERIVATQTMEGCEGQGDSEAVVTTVLVESRGRTTFSNTMRYATREIRDNVLRSGATSY